MKTEKISPKTIEKMLFNFLGNMIKNQNTHIYPSSTSKKKIHEDTIAYCNYIGGIADCIQIIKMKYDKKYSDTFTSQQKREILDKAKIRNDRSSN